ncbi:MAG TPA: pilus assembly protein PilM [Candidatus Paceibacterota bacterium]
MNVSGTSFLSRGFPVPHALAISNASVSLSDGVLRMIEVTHHVGSVIPKAWTTAPIPRTVRGEEKKGSDEIAGILRAVASKQGVKSAVALIHEGDAYAYVVRMPAAAEEDLHAAVEASLEANVPIPPTDVIFEYGVVRRDDMRGELVVAVCAISRHASDACADLLHAAGIFPAGLETEARALARAVIARGDRNTHALLSVMERHSVVAVVERGFVTFSSSIEVGAADLDQAVAKTFSISPEEARALRRTKPVKKEDVHNNHAREEDVFEAMIPVLSTIRDELSKVLSFARGQAMKDGSDKDAAVRDVILCGADALFPGFSRYIAETSHLPAIAGSAWVNALSVERHLPELDRESSMDYAALIGALIS